MMLKSGRDELMGQRSRKPGRKGDHRLEGENEAGKGAVQGFISYPLAARGTRRN